MRVIFEAKSQGQTLKLYHHGYLVIENTGKHHEGQGHFGFQLDTTILRDLLAANQENNAIGPSWDDYDRTDSDVVQASRDLVALARERVEENFDTKRAEVGEPSDGALILRLAAEVERLRALSGENG